MYEDCVFGKARRRCRIKCREADAVVSVNKAGKGDGDSVAITLKGNAAWRLTHGETMMYVLMHLCGGSTRWELVLEPTSDGARGYAITHGGSGHDEYIKMQNPQLIEMVESIDIEGSYELSLISDPDSHLYGMYRLIPLAEDIREEDSEA